MILFAIYSCRKYQDRAEFLYRLLDNCLDQTKVYVCIFFGKDEFGPIQTSCNHCILDCPDGYDNLANKTMTLFAECGKSNYTGIIKCDDDIFPNLNYLRKFIDNVSMNPSINYAGRRLDVEEHTSSWHIGKGSQTEPIVIPKSSYCTGPMYYLSTNAMQLLVSNKSALISNYNEDVMVGHNLNILGIEPTQNPLYADDPQLFNHLNIQNINNRCQYIFVRIHGGLGNQLFQCAAAYGIAKQCNALPVLVFTESVSHYQHNHCLREYIDTVFKGMCRVSLEHVNKNNFTYWSEVDPGTTPDACFSYNENMIAQIKTNQKNAFLNGYFQNERYFRDVKNELIKHLFTGLTGLTSPTEKNSYFIHVRRGDYVGNKLYDINYDAYLKRAIKHVLTNNNGNLVHFYVVTNDVKYCKMYPEFADKKMFSILDDKTMTTLDTLYFMASCRLGGICANSSFSWWGSYLNSNPDKRVYFPYEWMTNIPGPVDVYPDGAIVVKIKK